MAGDGADRRCIVPVEESSTLYLSVKACASWFKPDNRVYFQKPKLEPPTTDKDARWGKAVENFGVNMKETGDELTCVPKLCKPDYFPKKPLCSFGGPVPPTCLDKGMVHNCMDTRVGSQCQITCEQGFGFKCYTDATFTVFDVTDPANCPNYHCPALTIALGAVDQGISGQSTLQELVNLVKSTNLVRCEPEPCLIESDPAFTSCVFLPNAKLPREFFANVGTR